MGPFVKRSLWPWTKRTESATQPQEAGSQSAATKQLYFPDLWEDYVRKSGKQQVWNKMLTLIRAGLVEDASRLDPKLYSEWESWQDFGTRQLDWEDIAQLMLHGLEDDAAALNPELYKKYQAAAKKDKDWNEKVLWMLRGYEDYLDSDFVNKFKTLPHDKKSRRWAELVPSNDLERMRRLIQEGRELAAMNAYPDLYRSHTRALRDEDEATDDDVVQGFEGRGQKDLPGAP